MPLISSLLSFFATDWWFPKLAMVTGLAHKYYNNTKILQQQKQPDIKTLFCTFTEKQACAIIE